MKDNYLVCICMEVYKDEVADAIRNRHLKTVDEVAKAIGIGTACKECRDKVKLILSEIND